MAIKTYILFVERLRALLSAIDDFVRSDNSTSLGKVSGMAWKVWRGVWGISSNKATSSTTPSSYPLATLTFTSDNVSLSIGSPGIGAGASFWVTDADNWWAATYQVQHVCDTCTQCNAYCGGNCNGGFVCANYNYNTVPGNTVPGSCNSYSYGYLGCNAWSPGNCIAWNNNAPKGFCKSRNPEVCNNPLYYNYCVNSNSPYTNPTTYPTGNCIYYSCAGNYNAVYCCSSSTYDCNCVDQQKIFIFKNVANTITNIASSVYSSVIASFKVITSSNNVTIKTFSDNSWTSQIGSDWNQAVSPTQTAKDHGIIISQALYGTQGTTIDEFRGESL